MSAEQAQTATSERTCVACRKSGAPEDFVRVELGPEGEIAVTGAHEKAGRGAYLCPTLACATDACKRGFARSFKREVRAPEAKVLLAAELARRDTELLHLLQLERRKGTLLLGVDSVSSATPLVIVAGDLGKGSVARLRGVARQCRFADKAGLGRALGAGEVAAVGIMNDAVAGSWSERHSRRETLAAELGERGRPSGSEAMGLDGSNE